MAIEKEPDDDDRTSFWDRLVHPRPYILLALIIIGLIFELSVHLFQNLSAAYTHFFYLIIGLAGLWYQKKAIWIALLFGAIYLIVEYLPPYSISLDSIFRALMLCLVAIIVGGISNRMTVLKNRLASQNIVLQESHQALERGNKKMHILSSVTRHDILNKLTVLNLLLGQVKETEKDPDILNLIQQADNAIITIEKQITFTKYYQDIGIHAPFWHDVEDHIKSSAIELYLINIRLDIAISGLEIYADSLIKKVFYNLMENSIRHGEHVTEITFSFQETDHGGVIIYQDNGIGIPLDLKKNLFKRGFGKNTGWGLFLSREILLITGITIEETGEPGMGARFEILIPHGIYRIKIMNQ